MDKGPDPPAAAVKGPADGKDRTVCLRVSRYVSRVCMYTDVPMNIYLQDASGQYGGIMSENIIILLAALLSPRRTAPRPSLMGCRILAARLISRQDGGWLTRFSRCHLLLGPFPR